jgi:hypothetical protein
VRRTADIDRYQLRIDSIDLITPNRRQMDASIAHAAAAAGCFRRISRRHIDDTDSHFQDDWQRNPQRLAGNRRVHWQTIINTAANLSLSVSPFPQCQLLVLYTEEELQECTTIQAEENIQQVCGGEQRFAAAHLRPKQLQKSHVSTVTTTTDPSSQIQG